MPPPPGSDGVVAVVDIGTNSTRLLVAEVAGGRVAELERRTEVTGLGEGVDASGRLAQTAMERVYTALAAYREAIDRHGSPPTVTLATSAVRDSQNSEAFRAEIRERFGLEVGTISGEEESRLTFAGATSGRRPAEGPVLVLDIGGGSTELVIGRPRSEPGFLVSTPTGSVRQTERHLTEDPPPQEQLADLALEVQLIIEDAVPQALREEVAAGIAVAGTPTSLAAVDQELDPYDPDRVHGYRLELGACEQMLALLAGMPLERRRAVTGLHPDRAPTIVAGAVILIEAMRAFGLDSIEVSEADLLHGAALEASPG